MYSFRSTLGPVDLAFTDRIGGVGAAPGATPEPDRGLDLSLENGDEAYRAAQLRAVLDDFAPDDALADLHQVHGAEVVTIEGDVPSGRPDADAVVTAAPGVTLLVRAADCVPVLLADPAARVVGAAHAGRLGMERGVVTATVARMRDLGAGEITGWIGPHICGGCYEVPADLRDQVAATVPASHATTSWGTPSLDLGAGIRAQLAAAGVTVVDAGRCTRESPDLHSFRRDGAASGRQAGLVRIGDVR